MKTSLFIIRLYSVNMFTIREAGDGKLRSFNRPAFQWGLRNNSALHTATWQYRRQLRGTFQALPYQVYGRCLGGVRRSFVYGKQVPLFQSAVLRPLFRFGNSVFTSHRSPSPLHQQELKPVIPSHAIGAGDAPLNVHRREQYKPQFTSFAVHNASKSLKDTRTALVPSNNESRLSNASGVESSRSDQGANRKVVDLEADIEKNMQSCLEKFLHKIVELHDKLNYKHCTSSRQYETSINQILTESRQYFYKLESAALCQILKENDDWTNTSCVADIFHHDYFTMADILSVYLLQLLLAYNEHGFVHIDPSGTDPLSKDCDPFHVKGHHGCLGGKLAVKKELAESISNEKNFQTSKRKTGEEDASQLLKMLRWTVKFMQNPDLEEESFTNPSLEEIMLDCRPFGSFKVIYSFGHQLPLYSVAVGVLVDYLRHRRFNRTVF